MLARLAAERGTRRVGPSSLVHDPYMTTDDSNRLRVRLYWSDGRVEELKQSLDVTEQPRIARNSNGRHLHFAFTGVIDADGFAVYEQQPETI